MKTITLLVAVLLNFQAISAGYSSNCTVGDLSGWDWSWGYDLHLTIKDDHAGVVHTMGTKDVVGIEEITSLYLNATYENNLLTLLTNERFKKFEEEYEEFGYYYGEIEIEIKFKCTDNKTEWLTLTLNVEDVNNHAPILNMESYEFNFGTTIPQDYDFAKFLPISAKDIDFTNSRIYFSLDFNENLKLRYKGESDYDGIEYFSTLKALKEIKAPFREEFTLIATDGGSPPRNSTARLIVSVIESGNGEGSAVHPPVFSKHLYFANYSMSNGLQMEEPITIKYGAEDNTVIKQSDYQEYFQFDLNTLSNGKINITVKNPLPTSLLEAEQLLVIEVEAENLGLQMPGRTALIIRLPVLGKSYSEVNTPQTNNSCSAAYLINNYDDSVAPLITYLCVIFAIVVINAAVLAWYFQRYSLMVSSNISVPYSTAEAVNPEKMYKI